MSAQRTTSHMAKRPRLGERTMLACTTCKQKKLKCDGQSPRCQNCVRSDRECLVEDPATGLHRPRDYMQSLEARVAYLESLLQQVRPEVALDHLGSEGEISSEKDLSGGTAVSPDYPAHTDPPLSPMPPPYAEARIDHEIQSFAPAATAAAAAAAAGPATALSDAGFDQQVDVLSSEVALLCLTAAGGEPHYFGPSSAVSFSRIASATMGLRPAGGSSVLSAAGDNNGANTRMPLDLMDTFPAPATAVRLGCAYWRNIHPQYPHLHRPTFETWERQCLLAYEEGNMQRVQGLPLFFVLMVYAIGCLALGHTEYANAESYYSLALDHLPSVLELDSLESIQGILCCAVYSIRSHVGASLWKISGLAIRHCIEFGYHRSAGMFGGNMETLTKEMSRRCFWVAYDIDRVAASILGRPVGIPDDDIDVELPLDIDDEYITTSGLLRKPRNPVLESPTNMTGALHSIKLRQLWSKFNTQVYPSAQRKGRSWDETTVNALRQELDQWRASAPDRLDFTDARPLSVWASQEWFNLAYNNMILLLYRHHISRPMSSDLGGNQPANNDFSSVERALDECLHHSREMCLTYRRLYQRPTIQFTWGSLHILFMGGITYLYCLWRSPRLRAKVRQADIVSTCMACTTVLVIIAERWNLATTYRDIFEALSERTIGMMCGDSANFSLALGGHNYGSGTTATGIGQPGFMPSSGIIYDDPVNGNPGASFPNQTEPLHDWISALGDMGMPHESEWLVHELLQGVRQFEPDPLPGEFLSTGATQ